MLTLLFLMTATDRPYIMVALLIVPRHAGTAHIHPQRFEGIVSPSSRETVVAKLLQVDKPMRF